MDADRFYDDVARRLRVDREDAREVSGVVLKALHLRLHEEAAEQVRRALPLPLQAQWRHGGEARKAALHGAMAMRRGPFIHFVAERLGERPATSREAAEDSVAAREAIRAVFGALRSALPRADAAVQADLPPDVAALWTGSGSPGARPPTFMPRPRDRTVMDLQAFDAHVARRLGLPPDEAREVAALVLYGLHLSLREDAAEQLGEALPEELRHAWALRREDLKRDRGSFSRFTSDQFLTWLADHWPRAPSGSEVDRARQAVAATFGALRAQMPKADGIVRGSAPRGL